MARPNESQPPQRARRSRSRHAGSLTSYATQSGQRWKFQIYIPKDPERPELGDTRLTRGGFQSLDEAQRALDEALKKKRSHARFQTKTPTIAEYADHWVAGLRLQNSTIEGYKKILRNHITPYLGALRIDKLTATRIAAHYRELETSGRKDKPGFGKPLAANTVSKVHVLLAAMLDAAVDDGLILINPAKKTRTVDPPRSIQIRAQKPEIVTWTGKQLSDFLTWNRDVLDDDLFPLWRTLAYTGMRRSEALALRWADINFDTGRISIRRAVDVTLPNTTKVTKTGSARDIDIDTETLRVLKTYKTTRGAISLTLARADAYVFGDDNGSIRVPDAVTSRWTRRLDWATAKSTACPASPSKACGTPTPRYCSNSASTPRSSRNASATRPSPRP